MRLEGPTYIDNTSLSKMRIKASPKGIDSKLLSSTMENSLRLPDTVLCFARSITFRSRNCMVVS